MILVHAVKPLQFKFFFVMRVLFLPSNWSGVSVSFSKTVITEINGENKVCV